MCYFSLHENTCVIKKDTVKMLLCTVETYFDIESILKVGWSFYSQILKFSISSIDVITHLTWVEIWLTSAFWIIRIIRFIKTEDQRNGHWWHCHLKIRQLLTNFTHISSEAAIARAGEFRARSSSSGTNTTINTGKGFTDISTWKGERLSRVTCFYPILSTEFRQK